MHLIDQPGPQILLDRRDPTGEPRRPPAGGFGTPAPGAASMPSVTKWKTVPPSIGDRFAWMVR